MHTTALSQLYCFGSVPYVVGDLLLVLMHIVSSITTFMSSTASTCSFTSTFRIVCGLRLVEPLTRLKSDCDAGDLELRLKHANATHEAQHLIAMQVSG